MEPQVQAQSSLYDADYQPWLDQAVRQLKSRDFGALDLDNLIEEIESLGKSNRRALTSYLLRLYEHLLKLKYWKSERTLCFPGWILEISHFRSEIEWLLRDSPSLKSSLGEASESSYQKTRRNTLKFIGLPPTTIPPAPEFSLEQALDEDWFPWSPP